MLIVGLLTGSLVAAEVLLVVAGTASRLAAETRRRSMERQLLHLELETARRRLKREEQSVASWNGNRKFRIDRKVGETPDICSFYLAAHDNKPLPEYKPGQYLTFELDVPGRQKHVIRCYSLSDRPRQEHYRVTIKRLRGASDDPAAPPGLVSNFFHDQLKAGDLVDVRAPTGGFCLDSAREHPVVLLGGGIGITPLLSILNDNVASGSKRETWLFYGVRNSREHPFKEALEQIAREHENVHLQVCYSRPGAEDILGKDYQHAERVSVELLKRLLPSNNYEYYLCGPSGMMQALTAGLCRWEVPEKAIHAEAFGPASVRQAGRPMDKPKAPTSLMVHFAKSGREAAWNGEDTSLLDLATAANVPIDSGCRAGNCGTCRVAVKSGQVRYLKEPGCRVESGTCLTCCSVPQTEIVLDA